MICRSCKKEGPQLGDNFCMWCGSDLRVWWKLVVPRMVLRMYKRLLHKVKNYNKPRLSDKDPWQVYAAKEYKLKRPWRFGGW